MKKNEAIDLAGDGARSTATDDDRRQITQMVYDVRQLEAQIADIEQELKDKKQELAALVTSQIPQAMMKINMESFSTTAGDEVKIKKVIRASIGEATRERAFRWLRDNGHGDLIKNELKISIDRGQDNMVGDVIAVCENLGLEYSRKEAVHPQTLMVFVREQMNKGEIIPLDDLGVYSGREAVIKKRK